MFDLTEDMVLRALLRQNAAIRRAMTAVVALSALGVALALWTRHDLLTPAYAAVALLVGTMRAAQRPKALREQIRRDLHTPARTAVALTDAELVLELPVQRTAVRWSAIDALDKVDGDLEVRGDGALLLTLPREVLAATPTLEATLAARIGTEADRPPLLDGLHLGTHSPRIDVVERYHRAVQPRLLRGPWLATLGGLWAWALIVMAADAAALPTDALTLATPVGAVLGWLAWRLWPRRPGTLDSDEPVVIGIGDDGLTYRTPRTTLWFPWRTIARVEPHDDVIVVVGPLLILIPTEAFADRDAALAALRAHLPDTPAPDAAPPESGDPFAPPADGLEPRTYSIGVFWVFVALTVLYLLVLRVLDAS